MDIQVGTNGPYKPAVFAIPSIEGADGREGPSLVIHPTGLPGKPNHFNSRIALDLNEAEQLAQLILRTVADARAGKFDEIGQHVARNVEAEARRT